VVTGQGRREEEGSEADFVHCQSGSVVGCGMLDARGGLLSPAHRVSLAAQQQLLLPKMVFCNEEQGRGTGRDVGRMGSSRVSAEMVLPAPSKSVLVLLPVAASQGSSLLPPSPAASLHRSL